jgi:FixJ family two-component response regulator
MITVENSIVFVVDDDPSMRRGLQRLILSAGYAVETFASANEFLNRHPTKGPSCLVLDVKMPDISGLDLQEELLSKENAIPIIFISGHGDIPMSVKTLKKGAVNFLRKPVDEKDLLDAIHEALKKDFHARSVQKEQGKIFRRLELLTPREYEILRYVITGMLNKQIASALNISEITVKIHRGRVMDKMDVDSVVALVRLTEKVGIEPSKTHF